jgi:lysozyme
MIITDDLRNLLIRHEGLRLKPYQCPAGKWTIGVGHNMDANPLPDMIQHQLDTFGSITEDMAMELLDHDLLDAIFNCRRLYRDFEKFADRRKMALVDFVFNIGVRTARTFERTNRAINRGDWEAAAQGFEKSLWYRQVNHRAVEIVSMIREG